MLGRENPHRAVSRPFFLNQLITAESNAFSAFLAAQALVYSVVANSVPAKASRNLPLWKKGLYALFPLLTLLLLVEGAAILLGIGHSGQTVPPEPTEVIYGDRLALEAPYFPGGSPQFRMTKREKTFRIYCGGGSSVHGHHFSHQGRFIDVSWPTQMGAILHAIAPEYRYEVVNGGISGQNTFKERAMVAAAMRHDVDVLILQTGNNEFLHRLLTPASGPEGVWRALSAPRFVRALARNESAAGERRNPRISKPNYLLSARPYILDFEANLRAMVRMGKRAVAEVILVTPPHNRLELGPINYHPCLASTDPSEFCELVSQVDPYWHMSSRFELAESPEAVKEAFGSFLHQSDDFGYWARWHLGRTYAAKGRWEEAWEQFDSIPDSLRPRPGIWEAIREVAEDEDTPLVLAMEDFRRQVEGGVSPSTLVCDHVHLTARGNYLMARMVAEQVLASLGVRATQPIPGYAQVVSEMLGYHCEHHRIAVRRYMDQHFRYGAPQMVWALYNDILSGECSDQAPKLLPETQFALELAKIGPSPATPLKIPETLDPATQENILRVFPGKVVRSGSPHARTAKPQREEKKGE